jgi:hypothetical protein
MKSRKELSVKKIIDFIRLAMRTPSVLGTMIATAIVATIFCIATSHVSPPWWYYVVMALMPISAGAWQTLNEHDEIQKLEGKRDECSCPRCSEPLITPPIVPSAGLPSIEDMVCIGCGRCYKWPRVFSTQSQTESRKNS